MSSRSVRPSTTPLAARATPLVMSRSKATSVASPNFNQPPHSSQHMRSRSDLNLASIETPITMSLIQSRAPSPAKEKPRSQQQPREKTIEEIKEKFKTYMYALPVRKRARVRMQPRQATEEIKHLEKGIEFDFGF